MTGTSAEVTLRSIRKSYGRQTVLSDIDLSIAGGELLAVLGPSGCGKTTALRVIAGLERPDGGAVHIDGVDVTHQRINHRGIGIVFQAYSLFPHQTAAENVAYGLRVRGTSRSRRVARAAELLDLVGLAEHGAKYPQQLSGGQQQRVALARAFAIEPRVLLPDEPLSALDAKVRVQLREEIRVDVPSRDAQLFARGDRVNATMHADDALIDSAMPPDTPANLIPWARSAARAAA